MIPRLGAILEKRIVPFSRIGQDCGISHLFFIATIFEKRALIKEEGKIIINSKDLTNSKHY
jgi:hypothetical protein